MKTTKETRKKYRDKLRESIRNGNKYALVSRMYTGMKWRCNKNYKYIKRGVTLDCSREDFVALAMASKELDVLMKRWSESQWKPSLSPSVDRIDSKKGYKIGNIRFVTMSQNQTEGRKTFVRLMEERRKALSLPETK